MGAGAAETNREAHVGPGGRRTRAIGSLAHDVDSITHNTTDAELKLLWELGPDVFVSSEADEVLALDVFVSSEARSPRARRVGDAPATERRNEKDSKYSVHVDRPLDAASVEDASGDVLRGAAPRKH